MIRLHENEVFGLVKTNIDVHTLGVTTLENLLIDCGYKCYISPKEVSIAVEQILILNLTVIQIHLLQIIKVSCIICRLI